MSKRIKNNKHDKYSYPVLPVDNLLMLVIMSVYRLIQITVHYYLLAPFTAFYTAKKDMIAHIIIKPLSKMDIVLYYL